MTRLGPEVAVATAGRAAGLVPHMLGYHPAPGTVVVMMKVGSSLVCSAPQATPDVDAVVAMVDRAVATSGGDRAVVLGYDRDLASTVARIGQEVSCPATAGTVVGGRLVVYDHDADRVGDGVVIPPPALPGLPVGRYVPADTLTDAIARYSPLPAAQVPAQVATDASAYAWSHPGSVTDRAGEVLAALRTVGSAVSVELTGTGPRALVGAMIVDLTVRDEVLVQVVEEPDPVMREVLLRGLADTARTAANAHAASTSGLAAAAHWLTRAPHVATTTLLDQAGGNRLGALVRQAVTTGMDPTAVADRLVTDHRSSTSSAPPAGVETSGRAVGTSATRRASGRPPRVGSHLPGPRPPQRPEL